MKAILLVPGRDANPIEAELLSDDILHSVQALVGGYVEIAQRGEGWLALVDEDGWNKRHPLWNRAGGGRKFVGSVVVVGTRENEYGDVLWCGLTDEAAEAAKAWLVGPAEAP